MNIEHKNNYVYQRERIRRNEITKALGNVELVKGERVRVIVWPISERVRAGLDEAVARGELGYKPADTERKLPAAYYHPNFEYMVAGLRNRPPKERPHWFE